MPRTGPDERRLSELHPPHRNRYFYGQLLGVEQLTRDQDFWRAQQRLGDLLILGPGVLCGLTVTVIRLDGVWGLRVSAGVAQDGWGRRIVMPDEVEIPLRLTDEWGDPVGSPDDPLPEDLVLSLCLRVCEADHGPALVADPGCGPLQRCEAGSWVESYALRLRAGTAATATLSCADDVLALLRDGRLAEAVAALGSLACPDLPDDPCVLLAGLRVAADGTPSVGSPLIRQVAPTNRLLLALLTCLAARVEECCANPPQTFRPLAVAEVSVGNGGTVLATLTPPADAMSVPFAGDPKIIDITFTNAEVDLASIVRPSRFGRSGPTGAFLVTHSGSAIGGALTGRPGNIVRFEGARSLQRGLHVVTLRGSPPAITAIATATVPAHSLDGDLDGQAGGDFVFTIDVT